MSNKRSHVTADASKVRGTAKVTSHGRCDRVLDTIGHGAQHEGKLDRIGVLDKLRGTNQQSTANGKRSHVCGRGHLEEGRTGIEDTGNDRSTHKGGNNLGQEPKCVHVTTSHSQGRVGPGRRNGRYGLLGTRGRNGTRQATSIDKARVQGKDESEKHSSFLVRRVTSTGLGNHSSRLGLHDGRLGHAKGGLTLGVRDDHVVLEGRASLDGTRGREGRGD